jgi:DNA polymerase-1
LLQVHDELVLELDEKSLPVVAALTKSTMENAFQLDVPVIADMRVGANWEEMEAYTLD